MTNDIATRNSALSARDNLPAARTNVLDGVWWETHRDRALAFTVAGSLLAGLPFGVAAFTGHLGDLAQAVGL